MALTAHAMAGDRERFLLAGMDGCCTKPIRGESLLAEMKRVMKFRVEPDSRLPASDFALTEH
jgi:CheY-like chemotaxis protein